MGYRIHKVNLQRIRKLEQSLDTNYDTPGRSSGSPRKRTFRVHDFLNAISDERTIYPKGIISSLKESNFDSAKVERIEVFANEEHDKKRYGIVKEMFVAFSSESKLLKLADTSSNVIEVHGLRQEKAKGNCNAVVGSRLVLKRSEDAKIEPRKDMLSFYKEHTPNLFVSSHWLDIMNMSPGDRVIISNPIEHYEIPPPLT